MSFLITSNDEFLKILAEKSNVIFLLLKNCLNIVLAMKTYRKTPISASASSLKYVKYSLSPLICSKLKRINTNQGI